MQPKIHAAIFDMDGTLFDTEAVYERAEIRACAEFGYTMTHDIYLGTIGLPANGARGWKQHLRNSFGAAFPLDEVVTRVIDYAHQDLEQNGLPIKPGVLALLDWLDAAHIPCAIASSSTRQTIQKNLAHANLSHRFSLFVGGDEILHGKPAPDIFIETAHRLNVPIQHCAVFEDSVAGVRGGHASGAFTIMIPDMVQPTPAVRALTHAVLVSLHQAPALLQKLVG